MSNVFEFVAEARSATGSIAAKAVRRNGRVPAVVYGGEAGPEMMTLDHNEVVKHLAHEAVYSHVLDLKIGDKTQKAVLKHIQRHPAKALILHMDFLRIDDAHKIKVHVPLHFINEETSVGVKKGGKITHSITDVELLCMPSVLPEFIEVDLANLDAGYTLHLSDLILPAGVEVAALLQGADHDHPVVQIIKPKSSDDNS